MVSGGSLGEFGRGVAQVGLAYPEWFREGRFSEFGRGVAQLGLAHLHGVQGVAGSNPVAPTSLNP